MTCRASERSSQLSTEELESVGPANASASQPHPNIPRAHAKTRIPLATLRSVAPARRKSNRPSEAAIETSTKPISYNARFRPRPQQAEQQASRHTPSSPAAARFAQPNTARQCKVDRRSSFAVDPKTLFARLGPQRSTADYSAVVSPQYATAKARYLPRYSPAKASKPSCKPGTRLPPCVGM